jgi:hypothetical protein
MSRYIGDFSAGQIVRFTLATLSQQAKVPTTPTVALAFCVYKNSVSESTSGITVSIDFDGLAGVHRVAIDTSSDPTFYVSGEDYDVLVTAGEVDGISLARSPVRSFSIENRSRKANLTQVAGNSVTASSAVAFPASIADSATVARELTLSLRPTLSEIEGSSVLAKQASVANTQASVDAVLFGVNTLLARLSASVVTLFTDLIQMISGSGTALAKWTSIALSLAPTGGSAGSGTGARAVTLTVEDPDGEPLPGATVRISRAGESFTALTDLSGTVAFSLDDATWTVSITAFGFAFTPTTLPVATNLTQTYAMTQVSITPPLAFAGLCNVLFSVIHLGNPVQNASVVATLEDENPTVDNYLISRQVSSGLTDANGNCVLTMVQFSQFTRGGVYRIKVADSLGRTIHDRKVRVPDQPTANAEDLLDAR